VLRFLPDPGLLGQLGAERAGRLLDERARLLARRGAPPEAPAAAPVLVVSVGEELFGLSLARVAAVLTAEPPCPLPGGPAEVLGLRARAGRIHAVLDLARLLGVAGGDAGGHDVLLRGPAAGGGRRLALRVGRALSAVVPLPLPPDLAPPGPEGVIAFRAAIPGAAEEPRRALGVLDLDRLLLPYAAPLAASLPATLPAPSSGA